ncbi:MAG: hypothetical protein V1846_03035 [Candidatus Komeilibacteria bacterium]
MKKIIREIIPLLLILFSFGASAQSELLFGQSHYYSVVFRGNGEAIVYAKIAITNSQDTPMTDFSFEIPGVTPSEMVIIQQQLPRPCLRADYNNPTQPCLEYGDPNYAAYSAGVGYDVAYKGGSQASSYQKVKYTKEGNSYKLTFPTPIAPSKSGALVIAYAAKGYVTNFLGLQKFRFETIKVPARIETINVSVDVDSDLLLKGKQANVNYGTVSNSDTASPAKLAGLPSAELDRSVSQIGSYGALMKQAKNLAANESFVVKGEYSTNWFRLYLSGILWTIGIIIVIFLLLFFLTRRSKKRKNASTSTEATPSKNETLSIVDPLHAVLGFISALAVVIITYGFQYLTKQNFFYSLSSDTAFSIIAFIIVILLYVFFVFGLAIIVAIKHGWKSFLAIIVAELIWYLVFLIFYLVLFKSGINIYPPRIMY